MFQELVNKGVSSKIIGRFSVVFKGIVKKFERYVWEVSMVLKRCSRKFKKSLVCLLLCIKFYGSVINMNSRGSSIKNNPQLKKTFDGRQPLKEC